MPEATRRRVCVLERHDFAKWASDHARGAAAGRMPYGMEALEDRFEVAHSDRGLPQPLLRAARAAEYHGDREVEGVLANLGELRRASACLSVFEDFGVTYAWLRRRWRSLPPHVAVTCWISQRLLAFAHKQRDTYRRMVAGAEAVTVFSANQVPILVNRLEVPEGKVRVVDYGVVTDYFYPSGEGVGEGYVAAAGQDVGRDWPTFFAAAALVPDVRFKVATWESDLVGRSVPPNVEVVGGLPVAEYRRLLQGADAVVVATYPLPYPTGQSVMLEAMACGRPVVAARTPAMTDYLDPSANDAYQPGDAGDLASVVKDLVADPDRRAEMGRGARRLALERFDSRLMWARIGDLLAAAS